MASGTKPSPSTDDYVPRHAPKRVRKRATEKAGKGRSFLRRRWWLLVLLVPVLLALLGVGLFLIAYARTELPDRLPPIRTTFVYDRDGRELAELHAAVDRRIVPLSAISKPMLDAVIATEDASFYEHAGVDPIGIVRAAWTNLRGTDNEVQGASTITQQLVKNVYAGEYVTDPETGLQEYVQPERSVSQKIREVLLAIKLERELGKDRILAQYLNTVYFGQGAYGVEAAAQTYFDEPASELTVLEAATLAGVLHAPEDYDPIDRPEDNVFRRDYALDQMVRFGYLDADRAARLKQKECCGTVEEGSAERLAAPAQSEYFVDFVRQDLLDDPNYGSARVYGGGLDITTTLDLDLQRAAEEAIATHLPDPAEDPDAALVSIDVETGGILAMAGGRNWARDKFNLATFKGGTGRQAGSAFKAFTLTAALENDYSLNAVWSGPSTLGVPGCADASQPDGIWHPVNAEGSGTGTLLSATANSVNTVFAQLIAQLGPEEVVDAAHRMGIRSELPEVCSITLGSVGVNPLEMTNAYATLAARGVHHEATPYLQVKRPSGRVDRRILPDPEGKRAVEENVADQVTYALQGVIQGGTGSSAAIPPYPAAGKTGSANENVDAWFCGYTVQIATCVWVGFQEDEIPLVNINGYSYVYGGTIPAAIWRDYMSVAMDGLDPTPFPTPTLTGSIGPETPVVVPSPEPEPTESPEPEPTEDPEPEPPPSPDPEPPPSPDPEPPPEEPPGEEAQVATLPRRTSVGREGRLS